MREVSVGITGVVLMDDLFLVTIAVILLEIIASVLVDHFRPVRQR